MKVLMLGWELPPYNSGGLGVACLQLSRALADSGADIDFVLPYYPGGGISHMKVITMFKDPSEIALLPAAYQSYKEDAQRVGLPPANRVDNVFEDTVGRIFSYNEYDVIHAHDWLTFRAALRAKWLTNKPLVLHVHSVERDRAGGADGSPLVREIEATAMMMADRVIAVSQHTKDAIISDYGVPADRITVIHNAIDVADFQPVDEENAYSYLEYMKSRGWKVLINAGRLTIQKGLTQLVSAAAEAMYRCPKTFLLLVGSGEQRDELLSQAAQLGIADRCLFVGFQRGKNLRDAYRIADLFLMPSVSEPFGLVALEAVGYGVPVLISKQSGVAEALQSCLKVDFWDIREMTNQITSVLRNPKLGQELSANAGRELRVMTWRRPAEKLMRIYSEQIGAAA
jgi:glycosyltransferase involved in cell wall biosynthesis